MRRQNGHAKQGEGGADLVRRIACDSAEMSPFAGAILAGQLALGQHRFEEAASCFRQAVEMRPDDLESWTNLGEILLRWCGCLNQSGQIEAADQAFNRAVEALSKAVQLTPADDRGSALRARALVAAAASIYEARKVS